MQRSGLTVWLALLLAACAFCASCRRPPQQDLVLYDFEDEHDLDRLHWKCHVLYAFSPQHAAHGRYCLRMDLYPSTYPGLSLPLSRHDWRGFNSLCFEIFSPAAETLHITVRIDDRRDTPPYSDRYNRRFALRPGMNAVRIPIAGLTTSGTHRRLNAAAIERFMFFMVKPERRRTLFVDYIRLCRKRGG